MALLAMPPEVAATLRIKSLLVSKRVWGLSALALLAATYPFSCGVLGGRLVTSKLAKKLGVPVDYTSSRAGWGGLRISNLRVGAGAHPLLRIAKTEISFAAAWGAGTVVLESPLLDILHGGDGDNISFLLDRARKPSVRSGVEKTASYPAVIVKQGSVHLQDSKSDVSFTVAKFDALWEPSRRFLLTALDIAGTMGPHPSESTPTFSAEAVTMDGALSGMRPQGFPQVTVREGRLRLLTTLPLTGITGTLRPIQAGEDAIDVLFAGSYAGAKRSLWTATGKVRPTRDWSNLDGDISLRAERFSLDKIAEVLPASVLEPENTEVDAAIEAHFRGRRVALSAKLDVSGLSVVHEKLATEPVENAGFTLQFDGDIDRDKRRLDLRLLEGKIGSLVVRVTGSIELAPGKFRFKDGHELKVVPKIDLSLRVPRTPCAKILSSIPAPLVPRLHGFVLQGQFEAEVHSKIDFASLDSLDLGGRIGIDGCQVVKAPDEVLALARPESIMQTVEVPPPPGAGNSNEMLTFAVGPENPDFVPYEKISPYLIAAIMTTEDSGFFKHRGWVSSEFKTALRRNIAGGGFRLGASSITMQMVKNLLLSHEKTLSRKFQELFLVWYLEQILPKQRILELYFNAIEFGPRLYGIGQAAQHYFGKSASDLSPTEAAFFSSILPSPKRRYVQYCHGALTMQWEKYVRKILNKMHERGRLNDDEFTAAIASPLVFDKAEMTMTEKQCMDWVRKMTAKPEPEPEPEADGQ